MNNFFDHNNTPWEQVEPGIKRKIVGYTADLMAVHVCFEKGAIGEEHAHDEHDQIAFIHAGSFEVTVAGQTKILRQGDAFTAAKNVLHGVVALEDNSVIVDLFSPKRDEFL